MATEKTEEPTPKKLRDAREKGQVSNSKDVTSTALLVMLFVMIWVGWSSALPLLEELLLIPTQYYGVPFEQAFPNVLMQVLMKYAYINIPFLMATVVMGIAANVGQVGFLFVFEPLKPNFNKLNPAEGIKKMFNLKALVELIKSFVKVVFLGVLIFMVIRDSLDPLLKIPFSGTNAILPVLQPILKHFAVNVAFAYIIVAVADFYFQKRQHTKELRMTKDEVKREYKEMEGDPEIKGKRKQLQKELLMNTTIQRTRKASVLVTNPTHYAVALLYEKGKTPLPLVLAKGQDNVAQEMIRIAEEEKIPIMRDVPLARSLYADADVNQYIPADLVNPVAEVIRWVLSLRPQE